MKKPHLAKKHDKDPSAKNKIIDTLIKALQLKLREIKLSSKSWRFKKSGKDFELKEDLSHIKTNMKFSKRIWRCWIFTPLLFRIGFNLYRKNTGVRDKTTIFTLREETHILIPTTQRQPEDLEREDDGWGKHDFVDNYDTYGHAIDKHVYYRENEQSGSGSVNFLPEKSLT